MNRKLTVAVLCVASLALTATAAQGAVITGSWGGGKTAEYYYFSPSMTIKKSGSRYIGTSTAPTSWTTPKGTPPFSGGGIDSECTIPSGTQVLKLRKQSKPKNTYTGSVVVIYNLLTTGPGQPTPVPFACDTHIFATTVGQASNGLSFRLKSTDGPDVFPSVTYRKLLL